LGAVSYLSGRKRWSWLRFGPFGRRRVSRGPRRRAIRMAVFLDVVFVDVASFDYIVIPVAQEKDWD
jgi:hypothetical protein